MKLRWRNCQEVEDEHEADVRQYAHTFHYPQTICLAQAFWKLPQDHRDGIILHEVGHLLAGVGGDEGDANRAAQEILGARIEYLDSPYGKQLERVSNMAGAKIIRRNRNPHGGELPYGEWIPAHAVRFNQDGTVSLMTEESAQEMMLQNVAGYKVGGVFHPIRWDPDYDPEELSTPEPLYATTHAGLPGKRKRKAVRKRRR